MNEFKKLSPWKHSASYYWDNDCKGHLVRCSGGIICAELIRHRDGCWHVYIPNNLRSKAEVVDPLPQNTEIPLRLLFEVDLWLFENGYEVEDLFVFPEIGEDSLG